MALAKLETFATRDIAFVRATADDGATGWGQISTYQADLSAEILHRQVAPHVLGANERDVAALVDLVERREHKFPGSYLCRALGGLDTALFDMAGKREGVSVCRLLGGTETRLRAYASSMKRDITPEAEGERFKRLQGEFGFDAFKYRIGAECGRDADEWPGRTEAIVPAIRRALGPEATLLADANSGFSPARAIAVGRLLEGEGVSHFEEPCPYWELEQTREVAEALNIDITGGEQDCLMPVWRAMIGMRAVDVVQPDVLYMGGMVRTMRVAALAAEAGLLCTPHAANLGLVTLFTMHLLAAIPNAGPYLELSIEEADYYPWQYGLFTTDPYRVEDGHVTLSEAPGWGIEVRQDWLDRAAYKASEVER